MPCTNLCKERKKVKCDIGAWIIGEMRMQKYPQWKMAKLLGMAQQCLSKRLLDNNLDYWHLVIIFKELNASDKDILRMMKGE